MGAEVFDLAIFWDEGGGFMVLVLLAALAAEACGVVAILLRNPIAALTALAFAALPLALGTVGWAYNRAAVERAVAAVNPTDRALILTQGNKEALHPLQLGGFFSLFTFPTGLAALAFSRRKSASPPDPRR